MTFKLVDRVRETSISTGTGSFALSGATTACQAFSAEYAVGDTFHYTIAHRGADEWEVGLGTYSAANTLTRTTVYESSNADALVSFSAGTKDIFVTASGSKMITASDPSAGRLALGYNPAFEGVPLTVYGHSYGLLDNPIASARYPTRVQNRLNMQAVSTRSVSGDSVAKMVGRINNGYGSTVWTPGTRGVVVLNAVLNDVCFDGNAAQTITAYKDALRTCLRLLRCTAKNRYTHSSVTRAGSFSTLTANDTYQFSGGTDCYSATSHATSEYVDVAFAGDEFVMLTIRRDGTIASGKWEFFVPPSGGILTTTDGETEVHCTNGFPDISWNPSRFYMHSVRITGFGSGAHTVRCRKKVGDANATYFDSWLDMTGTMCPFVVIVKDCPLVWASAGLWSGGSDSILTSYNDAIDAVVAESEFSSYVVAATPTSYGWDRNTMLTSPGVHPNDAGHGAYTDAIHAAMQSQTFRYGLNYYV